MRIRLFLFFWIPGTAAFIAAVAGCERTVAPEKSNSAAIVRISPSKLFTGEFARVEPHLGLAASGCVQIDVPVSKLFIGFEPEIWQEGKAPRSLGTSLTREKDPTHASFSMREVRDAEGKRKYRLITAVSGPSGSLSSESYDFDLPAKNSQITDYKTTHYQPMELSEPRELKEDEATPIFGYAMCKDGKDNPSLLSVPNTVRWAIVIKMRWKTIEKVDAESN